MKKINVLLILVILTIYTVSFSAPSLLVAKSSGNPFQYTLEGLTRSPSVTMTNGSLAGWNEDDWIPFRLTIINKGEGEQITEAAVNLEYENEGRFGIDAFAACFSDSAPDCGNGRKPTISSSAVGNGSLWMVLVNSSIQAPLVNFSSLPGGVNTIQWHLSSLLIPANSSLSIRWAVHLAKGNSTNLACADDSPLAPCSQQTVPSGMGAASWPGSSLQVRATSPILGERTVSINVAHQTTEQTTTAGPVQEGCLIATAAYGSELASPVQFLRSFRDGQVMKTFAGSSFMEAFNRFYYSFSPTVAEEIAENSALKLPTRLFIYPLIGTLYLSSQIYEIFSVIPEVAVVMAGFSASLMIGAVYMFPVFLIISFFMKEKRHGITKPCKWIVLVAICGFLAIVIGEAVPSRNLAMTGSALFVITLILISGIGMIKISNYTLNRLSHR